MTKKYSLILAVLALLFTSSPVIAKNATNPGDFIPPEQEGVYDVPGHPNLKVKVFIHHAKPEAKPGKPVPQPPTKVCQSSAVADLNSDSVVDPTGWKLPSIWNYEINTQSVPSTVGSNNLADIAKNAFNAWQSAVGNTVSIKNIGQTLINRSRYDGHNIIAWSRASNGTLAVTYTWYHSNTGEVAEVDTIINQQYVWSWANPTEWPSEQICAYTNSYDTQGILTHELGHWMGLDDHYTDEYKNNTMYGYGYMGDAKEDTLTNGDIVGVNNIY